MEGYNLVDAMLAHDKETFMQAFNAAISSKVNDALEVKKVEIASNLLTPQEEINNEAIGIETEVDGTESFESEGFDDSSSSTAE